MVDSTMLSFVHLKNTLLSKHPLIAGLLLLLSILMGYLTIQFPWFSDFTQNQRNSLTSQSIQALQSMPAPIEIKALASNSTVKGKYFRKSIQSFVARYQRNNNNITVRFLSPETDMVQARKIGLHQEGEWLVSYKNQSDFFKIPYTEERFTNLLIKLQSGKERSFVFTDGHQEPKLADNSQSGMQRLAKVLAKNGVKIKQSNDLSNLDQAQILVINAPKKPFNQQELNQIQRHISLGRNLIWLIDAPNLQGLENVANTLNIEVSTGIAVDLSNQQFGLDPKLVSADHYAHHEIFTDFSIRTFFPNARRINEKANMAENWKFTQLVGVAENGWLTKSAPGQLSQEALTKNVARPGPINIAVALERTVKNQRQRILIIGSSEFLLNSTIDKGGNLMLALNMFKWTLANHVALSFKTNISKDSVVVISNDPINRYLILAIFNGFQFILPAILLLIAGYVWVRRSKM